MATAKRSTPQPSTENTAAQDVGATFDQPDFQGGPDYDPTLDDADVTGMPDPFPGTDEAVPYAFQDDVEELGGPTMIDDDLPEGDGVTETPLTWEYEGIAVRDDLARRLGDLVIDMRAWADDEETEDATEFAEELADFYERFGAASEDTDT